MSLDRMVGLPDLVEPGWLGQLCTSIHDLLGVGTRVYGPDGTLLAETVPDWEYCTYLREFAEGRRQCRQFRARLSHLGETAEAPATARCFSGCTYLASRVVFEGDEVGRVVYGPFLTPDVTRLPAEVANLDQRLDVNRLANLTTSVRRIEPSALLGVANIFHRVFDMLLQSRRLVSVTSDTHLAAMAEAYREVSEKNQQLLETAERLQEMDRLKSNFLATVSHELRTPLTSIIGYSEMLVHGLAGPLNDEQRRYVGTILEKGEELLRLVSAILDVSTLEASRIVLNRRPLDLDWICQEAADKALARSPRQDVQVQLRLASAVPQVDADPEVIEKALIHLLDNAIKFSPPSGIVEIEIGVTEVNPEGESEVGFVLVAPTRRYVQVGIYDRGPGIPEAEVDRIFEAFYQIDGSATRKHGGLGIGLTLARQFAQAHGGQIRVENRPEGGSVFRLLLPLAPGATR